MISPQAILADLKVVELATYIFAPASATVLSDYGAQVIKIERPEIGDTYRQLYALRPMPKSEINYNWVLEGRNKRSVALDVGSPEGREVLDRLVADADIFITNYRPSILAHLGLTYEQLHAKYERLIYAHATGFGEEGPQADKAGFDQTAYWAGSGLMYALHNADAEPCTSVCGMGDHPSAMALFGGIMLALYARERTGQGTKVSSSLAANGYWSNACQIQAAICGAEFFPRRKRTDMHNPLVNHYMTRDGQRLIVCLIQPHREWPVFCKIIGREDLIDDTRFTTAEGRSEHSAAVVAVLDAAIATRDLADWSRLFAERGIIWNKVASVQEIAADPGLLDSGFFVEVDDPQYGKMPVVDSPIHLRDQPKVPPRSAPAVGQHTREVLTELGYDQVAIDRLLDERIASVPASST